MLEYDVQSVLSRTTVDAIDPINMFFLPTKTLSHWINTYV